MELKLEYNSLRDFLKLPEYGRNIQKLVLHAKTIENKEYRQKFVELMISLMMQVQQVNMKNFLEYKEKLWNHVFMIADYELDVEVPEDVKIHKVTEEDKMEALDYPQQGMRFRHYGKHVQTLVQKAIETEEGPKKDQFIKVIATYMKSAYRTWNREHYVNDEIIKGDLKKISSGSLELPEGMTIEIPSGGGGGHVDRKRRGKKNGGSKNRRGGSSKYKRRK